MQQFDFPSRFVNPIYIGAGSYSSVFEAFDKKLERKVAIKWIPHTHPTGVDLMQKIAFEIRVLSNLNHPGITRLLEVLRTKNATGLIMPLYSSITVKPFTAGDRLTLVQRLNWIESLLAALVYVHSRHIVHGDIKPSNILEDKSKRLVLADFGSATEIGCTTDLSQSQTTFELRGSIGYCAPEVLEQRESPSYASDLYSSGVTIYELLSGVSAFPKDNAAAIRMALSDGLPLLDSRVSRWKDWNAVLQKACHRDPKMRFDSAKAMLAEVQHICEGGSISIRKVGYLERLRRWKERQPVVAYLTLSLIAVVNIGITSGSYAWREALKHLNTAGIKKQELLKQIQSSEEADAHARKIIEQTKLEIEKANEDERACLQKLEDLKLLSVSLESEKTASEKLIGQIERNLVDVKNSEHEVNLTQVEVDRLSDMRELRQWLVDEKKFVHLSIDAMKLISEGKYSEAKEVLKTIPFRDDHIEHLWMLGLINNRRSYPEPSVAFEISEEFPGIVRVFRLAMETNSIVASTDKLVQLWSKGTMKNVKLFGSLLDASFNQEGNGCVIVLSDDLDHSKATRVSIHHAVLIDDGWDLLKSFTVPAREFEMARVCYSAEVKMGIAKLMPLANFGASLPFVSITRIASPFESWPRERNKSEYSRPGFLGGDGLLYVVMEPSSRGASQIARLDFHFAEGPEKDAVVRRIRSERQSYFDSLLAIEDSVAKENLAKAYTSNVELRLAEVAARQTITRVNPLPVVVLWIVDDSSETVLDPRVVELNSRLRTGVFKQKAVCNTATIFNTLYHGEMPLEFEIDAGPEFEELKIGIPLLESPIINLGKIALKKKVSKGVGNEQ